MSISKIAMFGVTSILMAMVMCGCATKPPTDEEVVDMTLVLFEADCRTQEIDKIMKHFSDNYQGDTGATKSQVRDAIEGFINQGVYSNFKMDYSKATKKFEGDKVTVTPVTWTTGEQKHISDFTYEFKKEGVVFRIVNSYPAY